MCRLLMCHLCLQSLLHDPNPNSPANNEAAQLFRENRREYNLRVASIVTESWKADDNDEDEDSDKEDEKESSEPK